MAVDFKKRPPRNVRPKRVRIGGVLNTRLAGYEATY
jgi:hypothetical protein